MVSNFFYFLTFCLNTVFLLKRFDSHTLSKLLFVLKCSYVLFSFYAVMSVIIVLLSLIFVIEAYLSNKNKVIERIIVPLINIPDMIKLVAIKLFIAGTGIKMGFILYGIFLYWICFLDAVGGFMRRIERSQNIYWIMQTKNDYKTIIKFIIKNDPEFLNYRILTITSLVFSDSLVLYMNSSETAESFRFIGDLFSPELICETVCLYNFLLLILERPMVYMFSKN